MNKAGSGALELPRARCWTGRTPGGLLAGFLNIGFVIEGNPLCCHIRGTRTARARRTKAADGFPAPMNYFEVTETRGPLRVVRREITEWGQG